MARAATILLCWTTIGLCASAVRGQQPAESPDARRSSCVKECHQNIVSHKVNHRVSETQCDACHVQGNPKEHRFYLIAKPEQLCARCHAPPGHAVVHAPAAQGRCTDCHDPHGSDHPKFLKADPQRDLCVRCHTRDFSSAKFVHGPVAAGACIVCHQPHSSPQKGLLVAPQQQLCYRCHTEVQNKAARDGHTHGALQQGCTPCHDAHASEHRFQLKSQPPTLCMTCHGDHFQQLTSGAAVVHGPVKAGMCMGCHEPHSARSAGLPRKPQPAMCLECHDRAMAAEDGKTVTNMAALLATNHDHHGPIREGNCTACHQPHAGRNFRLLTQPYPPDFYAPFDLESFKLCFQCHIPDLVLSQEGRGLTEFRDGDRNLHFVHVNREKGRTCRSCHEVHASTRPSHIRESVPFGSGSWLLPLNYEKLADGGSCAPGCHKPQRYNRVTPVLPAASPATEAPPSAVPAPADGGAAPPTAHQPAPAAAPKGP